jgi:hypothetical protein
MPLGGLLYKVFLHLRTKLNVVKEIDGFLNVDIEIDALLC